ncbi:MAG: chemotaxis protein CheA, partial [Massilia sp.]
MSHDQNDLSQFSMMDLFRMEADGQTQAMTDGLLALERGGGNASTVDAMMRSAHSIKGAAAIVGLDVIVQLAHAMEDAFIAAQNGKLELTPARIDVLLAGVDLIVHVARQAEGEVAAWLDQQGQHINTVLGSIAGIASIVTLAPPPMRPPVVRESAPTEAEAPAALEEVPQQRAAAPRATHNFDKLLALASESRINAHQIHPFIASLQRFKRNQGVLFQALEQLHEAVLRSGDAALAERSQLAVQKAHPLKQFIYEHLAEIESYERRLLTVSKNMVDEVLALRMRPFRDGVQAFPRMVRDLARSLGKEAQLTIEGEETLVDRDILAKIESPLNHMLRNAVDHGLETPEQRAVAGKPALGSITMTARHRAGMLSIEIRDDGRGVDLEHIRRSVVARKMASSTMAAAMSAPELMEFLFLPAFSLKEGTSEISGRGVGLDIVLQTIREQNGTVRMESDAGHGMRTSITLPLTQSVVRALVIDIQGEAYAIPIVKVEKVLMLAQSAIHTLESKQFFDHGGEHLGLVSAAQVLELGQLQAGADELAVVVIGSGQRRYALVVDAVRGEQSLAVQALDNVFGKMRDISAAALLDDGAPVLILDVPDLLLSIDKLLGEGGLHQL